MAKYHGITTGAGTEFEVGLISVELIEDEFKNGTLSGYLLIYKKGELHAKVHIDKVDTFYYSK